MFSQKRQLNETRSDHSVVFCYRSVPLRNLRHRAHARSLEKIVLSAVLMMGCIVQAQESSPPQQAPSATTQTLPEEIENNRAARCVEPAPLVHWEDYRGKFRRVGGLFARKLERKSVHITHYKPGALLCTLEVKDKFLLFTHDTFDPVTFIDAGYNAGIGHAENSSPAFGRGAAGYSQRVGAGFAGQASSEFFRDFAYPTVFSEDPRYYPPWLEEEREGVCSTQQAMCSSHTERTARICSISPNGSERQALSRWPIFTTQTINVAFLRQPSGSASRRSTTAVSTYCASFGLRLRGNSDCLSAASTSSQAKA